MHRCSRILACGLGLFCLSALAAGQTESPQAPAPAPGSSPERAPLKPEELATIVRIDALTIPTPGELMAALNKVGKPDWSAKFRPPTATSFRSRAQMALNLGGLIADGYIAVEAQDAQQVKNIGKDIVALAKPLGVQQEILNRGKSLTDFATESKWDVLKEELEATQNETKMALAGNKDSELITLVTIGGWIRGAEAISSYLAEHYSPEGARLLRQPGIVRFLNQQMDALPEKLRDDTVVKRVRPRLSEIENSVSFPPDQAPSLEVVRKLNSQIGELLKEISRKDTK